jgi:hypothetical protein
VDYHHSGWRGLNPPQALSAFVPSMGKGSAAWGRDQVWNAWSETQDTTVGLYVTDGGGPAALMIDPDFHNHYDAPTASCPNVDAAGNCLGKWFWKPANARQELFSAPGVSVWPNVTIPASVIASLSPGLHKLVFMTSDLGDCARQGRPCPIDMRGIWTNVHVLPFQVN